VKVKLIDASDLRLQQALCRRSHSRHSGNRELQWQYIGIITSPLIAARSIVISVSVCLSVRSHISKTTCPNSTKSDTDLFRLNDLDVDKFFTFNRS